MTKRNTGINIATLQALAGELGVSASVDEALREAGLSRSDRYRPTTDEASDISEAGPDVGCTVKQLPSRLLFQGAEIAAMVNPTNAPVVGRSAADRELPGRAAGRSAPADPLSPQRLDKDGTDSRFVQLIAE